MAVTNSLACGKLTSWIQCKYPITHDGERSRPFVHVTYTRCDRRSIRCNTPTTNGSFRLRSTVSTSLWWWSQLLLVMQLVKHQFADFVFDYAWEFSVSLLFKMKVLYWSSDLKNPHTLWSSIVGESLTVRITWLDTGDTQRPSYEQSPQSTVHLFPSSPAHFFAASSTLLWFPADPSFSWTGNKMPWKKTLARKFKSLSWLFFFFSFKFLMISIGEH